MVGPKTEPLFGKVFSILLSKATRDEWFIRGIGVSLAVASTAFAVHMATRTTIVPEIPGVEHFAIFSKPALIAQRRRQEVLIAKNNAPVDYTPTSALRTEADDSKLDGLMVIKATAEWALIRTKDGQYLRVARGDSIQTVGKVEAIRLVGDKWEVKFTRALIRQR